MPGTIYPLEHALPGRPQGAGFEPAPSIGPVHSTNRHVPPLWERLEALLFHGNWPARLARRLGFDPKIRVVQHQVHLKKPNGPRPLRLAFASDFHAGPTTDPGLLELSCRLLAEARPDVLLLGGDYVCLDRSYVDWLAPRLGAIPAPLGRFAVLGNHDWWTGAEHIAATLEAAGIALLTNQNARLRSPFDNVWICGLDDHLAGQPNATAALAGAHGARVVLMHSPDGLIDLGSERFDLALCGHTHGGQVALPGGIPLVVPGGRLCRKYARGRFDLERNAALVVSVGVGCSGLPFRTYADPEILVCELVPATSLSHPVSAASPLRGG